MSTLCCFSYVNTMALEMQYVHSKYYANQSEKGLWYTSEIFLNTLFFKYFFLCVLILVKVFVLYFVHSFFDLQLYIFLLINFIKTNAALATTLN